jgi:hypothetical protein
MLGCQHVYLFHLILPGSRPLAGLPRPVLVHVLPGLSFRFILARPSC